MPLIKELKKWLDNYDDNEPCAYTLWLSGDVESVAEDKGFVLTEDQIADVLDEVHHKHDASIGINWDVIIEYLPEDAKPIDPTEEEGED